MAMKRVLCGVVLGVCGVLSAGAQMGSGPKVAPGTMIEPSKTFDAMLGGMEEEFLGVAKAMPADKYNFAPSQATFASGQTTDFTGVRSFGYMVGHVAQANYFYASAASGMKPDVDVKAIGSMTDKDQLIKALEGSFAYAHKAMGTLTTQNAFESVRGTMTRATAAGGLVAHAFDHYGQLVEYLRMNGIVPPASRK